MEMHGHSRTNMHYIGVVGVWAACVYLCGRFCDAPVLGDNTKKKSRYSRWWFQTAREAIKRYDEIRTGTSPNDRLWTEAIEKTLKRTKELPDGDLQVRAIEMLYFKHTHTFDGVAAKLYTSRRTVQRWSTNFIYAVGKNAGCE